MTKQELHANSTHLFTRDSKCPTVYTRCRLSFMVYTIQATNLRTSHTSGLKKGLCINEACSHLAHDLGGTKKGRRTTKMFVSWEAKGFN